MPVLVASLLLAGGAIAGVVWKAAHHGPAAEESRAADVPRRVGDGIEVTPHFLEESGVVTEIVSKSELAPLVKVLGTAEFDPTHVAAVGTRAPGIVSKVLHVEGDLVEKGDLLAEVESPSLSNAQADLRIAGAKKRAALLNERREQSLLDRQLTTAREAEEAEAHLAEERALAAAAAERVQALGGAGGPAGVSRLKAPVAGVVAERHVSAGQSVGPSFVAFRVGDLDRLWVVLTVFERHVGLLQKGDDVDVQPVSDESQHIQGKIAHVGTVLDPASRTARVRVDVENRDLTLRPGQAVNATIHASGPSRLALSVPASALTYVDGAPTVFVAESPTRFVPRKVTLGIDAGPRVEVTSGVEEGQRVVSKSVLALKSELFR